MKLSISNSLFIGLVFVLASFAPSAEFTYTSIEGKFSIAFPATYKSVSEKAEEYTTVKTQASLDDQLYYISHSIHKSKLEEHESFATISLESFNKSMGGSIVSQAPWSMNEHSGVQAVIEVPNKNFQIAYRAILIGQIQYQIIVASEPAKWNQESADEFIESFKVEE